MECLAVDSLEFLQATKPTPVRTIGIKRLKFD